jgi:hypothetical protein
MAFARRDVGRDAFKSVVGRWGRFHAHALEEIGRTEEAIEEIQGALRLLSGRQARLGMLFNRLGREAEGKPVLNDLLTHMRREPKFRAQGAGGLSWPRRHCGAECCVRHTRRRAGHPRLCRDERAADGTIFGLARVPQVFNAGVKQAPPGVKPAMTQQGWKHIGL